MESKTNKRRMIAKDIEEKALDLRRDGLGYRLIAERLGCSEDQVWRGVQRAYKRLQERINEKAADVRELELQRLDHLLAALTERITAKEVPAILAALRICESRRRLLGLDIAPMPQKQTIEIQPGTMALTLLQQELSQKLQEFQQQHSDNKV